MSKISIYEYVADNNPQQVDALLQQFGYPPTASIPKLVKALKQEVSRGNEQILFSLADIHPDADLIESRKKSNQSKSNTFNACGACSLSCDGSKTCNCNKGSNTYSADASPANPNGNTKNGTENSQPVTLVNYTPIIIGLAATVVVSTVLIVAVSALRNK